jgi:hypothetical protein
MAVTYAASLKATRMQDVLTAIDAGGAAATLEICSAAYAAVLATITLAYPATTRSGAVLTFAGMPKSDSSADNTGTAAIARIKDSAGNVVAQDLTVGTSGANINLNSTSITATQAVSITSGTITHG